MLKLSKLKQTIIDHIIFLHKIKKDLNFDTKFTIEDAVRDLKYALKKTVKKYMTDDLYFNIKRMNNLNLK